jgi:AsmA protein
MKRLFKIILVLLLLIIIAAVAAPFLIPPETVKEAVLAQIIKASGRKVTIDKVSFSIFPDVGFTADNVVVPEPDWATGDDMMHIGKVHLGVELMPLLQMHPQVRVTDLMLTDPVIRLVKRGARANWQFSDETQDQPRANAAARNAERKANGVSADAFSLDKITIKNGTFTYDDGSPAPRTVSGLNVTVEAPNPAEKVVIDGSADYNGEQSDITLTLRNPLALASGRPLPVNLKFKMPHLMVYWQGTLALAGPNNMPVVTGNIDIPELNTADFKSSSAPEGSAAAPSSQAAAATSDSRWSDAPIRLDALQNLNIDVKVTVDKLILPETSLNTVQAKLIVAFGGLRVATSKINAYDGTVSAGFFIGSDYKAGFSATVSDVKAEPLLHDFAHYDKLSGVLLGRINVQAQGKSERQMIATLGGTGDFHYKDGTYKGANLLSLVHNITSATGVSSNQTTTFSDLSGTYSVKNGIVTNNDLKLVSASLHLSGTGTIDLPQWQVHYLLKPELVGGATGGLIVPVNVDGPLDNPGFKPNLQAAVTDNLKDPAMLKNNLKALRQKLLQDGSSGANGIKGLLNGL